jgi:putative membrane protein
VLSYNQRILKETKMNKYYLFLLTAFMVAWALAAINPVFPDDWLLENYLVFIFVPIIVVSGYYFRLSYVSYTLITIFMILHVIGSHYTYEHVPFGYTLQEWFGAERNMYDRMVHFSFGFLLAYPIREMFMRISKARGFWSYYLPFDVALSFSAIYEIIEWQSAKGSSAAGIAFLGAQGDIWDAQKDMLMAGIGALIAMMIIFLIRAWLDKNIWKEMKESFKLPKNDKPLGEVKLKELIKKGP